MNCESESRPRTRANNRAQLAVGTIKAHMQVILLLRVLACCCLLDVDVGYLIRASSLPCHRSALLPIACFRSSVAAFRAAYTSYKNENVCVHEKQRGERAILIGAARKLGERERESVCVCVCVRERERERERGYKIEIVSDSAYRGKLSCNRLGVPVDLRFFRGTSNDATDSIVV